MSKIIDIHSKTPKVKFIDESGNQNVIPLDFFQAVVKGRVSINRMHPYGKIVPEIIREWLKYAHRIDIDNMKI